MQMDEMESWTKRKWRKRKRKKTDRAVILHPERGQKPAEDWREKEAVEQKMKMKMRRKRIR